MCLVCGPCAQHTQIVCLKLQASPVGGQGRCPFLFVTRTETVELVRMEPRPLDCRAPSPNTQSESRQAQDGGQ